MRARIGDYWLAGDPVLGERKSSSCGGFQMTPVRIQQQVEGWKWTVPLQHDRGNMSHQVEFETTRLFESFEDLQDFMFTMADAHAWEGTVTFREDGQMPGTWSEFDLENCTIRPPTMAPTGVSLRLHYSILGGTRSASRSGAWGARITEDGEDRATEDGGIRVQEPEPES